MKVYTFCQLPRLVVLVLEKLKCFHSTVPSPYVSTCFLFNLFKKDPSFKGVTVNMDPPYPFFNAMIIVHSNWHMPIGLIVKYF